MLVAGRNLLVEREVRFSNFRVNAPDFASTRAAARGTNHVMYRETDRGLRYFVKKGEERVVQENPTTTAKALAFGVTIDPSYDFPLPIVGINYLDFEFLGQGPAARAPLRRRARPGQRAAPEDPGTEGGCERGPVRHCRARQRPGLRHGRRGARPAPAGPSLLHRRQPGLAVHRLPEADRQLPVPLRPLLRGRRGPRPVSRPGRAPSPTASAWPTSTSGMATRWAATRFTYGAATWQSWGTGEGLRPEPAVVPEVQRQPDQGLLLRPAQGPSQRRLLRRPAPRPVLHVPVRLLRREPDPRRAVGGRALRRAGDAAHAVLLQPVRPVPRRPLPRAGHRQGPDATTSSGAT